MCLAVQAAEGLSVCCTVPGKRNRLFWMWHNEADSPAQVALEIAPMRWFRWSGVNEMHETQNDRNQAVGRNLPTPI